MKLFCTALVFSITGSICMAAIPATIKKPFSVQNNFSDSIEIHSYRIKRDNVRVFPNPTVNGKLTIHSTTSAPMHFYIFDVEGVLIRRIELKAREQRLVADLEKGTYSYDVFINDESIEQGKIVVR